MDARQKTPSIQEEDADGSMDDEAGVPGLLEGTDGVGTSIRSTIHPELEEQATWMGDGIMGYIDSQR